MAATTPEVAPSWTAQIRASEEAVRLASLHGDARTLAESVCGDDIVSARHVHGVTREGADAPAPAPAQAGAGARPRAYQPTP